MWFNLWSFVAWWQTIFPYDLPHLIDDTLLYYFVNNHTTRLQFYCEYKLFFRFFHCWFIQSFFIFAEFHVPVSQWDKTLYEVDLEFFSQVRMIFYILNLWTENFWEDFPLQNKIENVWWFCKEILNFRFTTRKQEMYFFAYCFSYF